MNDIVIQVDNVSKYYRLGVIGTGTLSHDLNRWWAMLRGRPDPTLRVDQAQKKANDNYIWALKDVSFEVKQGEVLGIIGRNGAGKSTLLKILSRVTAPTTGECRVKGRIASLLEIGTGFHPDLTGRENIFLNGAILGMTKEEIIKKFDEIVAFSEVEKYIDTPVKRYSSGMYVRLAFAVAAHLEPEIIIIDEVLAVGDAAFQQKCLGKMRDVAEGGRTVLFVSHNMAAISRLCSKVLLLHKGTTYGYGNTEKIVDEYMIIDKTKGLSWNRTSPYPDKPHIRNIRICNSDGSPCLAPTSSSQFGVEIEFYTPGISPKLSLGLAVHNRELSPIFSTSPIDCGINLPQQKGVYQTRVIFPEAIFMPKEFSLTVALYTPGGESYESLINVIAFVIEENMSLANVLQSGRWGDLQILCDWKPINKIG
jgi:lipopolysaccharide transport system ATP-binding protein